MVQQRYNINYTVPLPFLLLTSNFCIDLDPVPIPMRTWKPTDYWAYWCSDMLAPPLASTVSSVMSLGFTARETLPIVFFGFCICSVVITLTGRVSCHDLFDLIMLYQLNISPDGCDIPYPLPSHRQKHVWDVWKLPCYLYSSVRRNDVCLIRFIFLGLLN